MVVLGTGIGLYASAASDLHGLRSTCGLDASCSPSAVDQVTTRGDASYALFAVAGALAAADVVLIVLRARARTEAPRAWLAPAGRGLVLQGTF